MDRRIIGLALVAATAVAAAVWWRARAGQAPGAAVNAEVEPPYPPPAPPEPPHSEPEPPADPPPAPEPEPSAPPVPAEPTPAPPAPPDPELAAEHRAVLIVLAQENRAEETRTAAAIAIALERPPEDADRLLADLALLDAVVSEESDASDKPSWSVTEKGRSLLGEDL
jgi:outer membrane biosynthesis protein TonB